MLYTIKVPGTGVFELPFPSAYAAQTWAAICFPRCHPATVTRKKVVPA